MEYTILLMLFSIIKKAIGEFLRKYLFSDSQIVEASDILES